MNEARKRENPALQSQSTAQGDQRFQLQAVSCAGDGAPDFPTIEIYTLPLFFQARPGAIQRIQVLSRVCAKRNSPRGSRGKSSKKEHLQANVNSMCCHYKEGLALFQNRLSRLHILLAAQTIIH